MNNQQSFYAANYRGGQQGQQPSFASSIASQYQGIQKQYQPTGFVQAVYGQNNQQQNQNNAYATAQRNIAVGAGVSQFQGQLQGQSGQYGSYQNQNPQSFHAANYRGNQPGHDSYLRADSTQPSQFGTGFANPANQQYAGNANIQSNAFANPANQQYAGNANIQSNAFANQYQAQQNPQSFHAANYRGNQPGHDNNLRADSQQPTNQSAFGSTAATSGYGSTFNQGISSFAGSTQAQNPQSFHLANYQGNQPGHDQQLRADSIQPSNFQSNNVYGQR